MITLKCSLNKSIISCDVKQPYIISFGSIDKDTLSESLKDELDSKVDKESGKGLSAVSDISIMGGGAIGITPPDNWEGMMITKTNGTIENVDFYNKDQMKEKLNAKVDKESGKGLSTNDYTNMDKAEVAKVKDKVGFTDYATTAKAGVVTAYGIGGISLGNRGELSLYVPTEDNIASRHTMYGNLPITIGNLDYAVRSVRPNVVINDNQDITLTCDVNTIYVLGGDFGVTNLNITLPTTGQYGDFIQVDFFSDLSSPNNLIINSSAGVINYDLIPQGNCMYSLYFDCGISYSTGFSEPYGWRFGYSEYPYVEV